MAKNQSKNTQLLDVNNDLEQQMIQRISEIYVLNQFESFLKIRDTYKDTFYEKED